MPPLKIVYLVIVGDEEVDTTLIHVCSVLIYNEYQVSLC